MRTWLLGLSWWKFAPDEGGGAAGGGTGTPPATGQATDVLASDAAPKTKTTVSAADALLGGGAGGQAASTPPPVASQAGSGLPGAGPAGGSVPPAAAVSPPGQPNVGVPPSQGAPAGGVAPATPAAGGISGLRAFARSFGVAADQFPDEQQFARALLQNVMSGSAQAREYEANKAEFEQWRAQRAGAQPQPAVGQPQPGQAKSLLERKPPFDPRWNDMLEKDQFGRMVPKLGAPPDVLAKIGEHQAWRQEVADQLINDPVALILPALEQKFSAMIQQHVGQASEARTIGSIVAANESWIFASGQDGRPLLGLDGRRQPSPAGALYMQNVKTLGESGITDPQRMHDLALQLTHAAVLQANAAAAKNGQQNDASKQAALNQINPPGTHVPNRDGMGLPGGNGTVAADNGHVGLSIRESLAKALEAVPEAQMRRDFASGF